MSNEAPFIVVEAIDGGGKGEQVKLLVDLIFGLDKKNHVFLTREPYNSIYHDQIREIIRVNKNPTDNAKQLAQLYEEDRKIHCEIMKKILSMGIIVVSDRYKHATLAYQWAQGLDLQELIEVHKGLLIPDLTIIMDVPAEVALERINRDKNRTHKEVFEQLEFMKKLKENYLALPAHHPDEKIVIIDGNREVDEVAKSIQQEVEKIL